MPYTAPVLRKRADKSPNYCFYCEQCESEADGYTLTDIDNPLHPAALNVYCHGKSEHFGISSMQSFRDMMAPHEYVEGQPHPAPYKLFHPNDFAPRRDSRDPVDGTEL